MAIIVKEREIVYCYVDGTGQEQVITLKASEEGESIGYDTQTWSSDGYVRIWKKALTGQETTIIPKSRIVFIRQIDRP